jgi:uncharacterized protein (TIGR02300 family)
VAKAEWGIKRTCQSCDSFFYDLKKDPIVCPKCLSVYDEQALLKKRSVELLPKEDIEVVKIADEDGDIEDDFYLEKASDLLESLEDLEGDLETQQTIHISNQN